jgi:hypothetical protein
MELIVQLVGLVRVPLNARVLLPCVEPKPVPVMVTDVPAEPEVGERLVILGTTPNETALLAIPSTVTTTLPVDAADGTDTTIDPGFQLVGVADAPLKVTVLMPWLEPKPEPVIVIGVPTTPDAEERVEIVGTTVKAIPLLAPPFIVTTTLPDVAAKGTDTTMDVAFQLVAVAGTPPKLTTFEPCDPPNPVPVIVTDVPTTPEVVESLVMTGSAVPVPERLTVCGLLLALSVIVSVPGCEPALVGLNFTLTVQVPWAANSKPHVLV